MFQTSCMHGHVQNERFDGKYRYKSHLGHLSPFMAFVFISQQSCCFFRRFSVGVALASICGKSLTRWSLPLAVHIGRPTRCLLDRSRCRRRCLSRCCTDRNRFCSCCGCGCVVVVALGDDTLISSRFYRCCSLRLRLRLCCCCFCSRSRSLNSSLLFCFTIRLSIPLNWFSLNKINSLRRPTTPLPPHFIYFWKTSSILAFQFLYSFLHFYLKFHRIPLNSIQPSEEISSILLLFLFLFLSPKFPSKLQVPYFQRTITILHKIKSTFPRFFLL